MHLLLIRHGQTDDNARGVLQGQTPTRLNDLGRQQAAALAASLVDYKPRIEALVSSDLPRALETAGFLAESLGLGIEQHPAWRERSFGPYEGKPVGEAETWRKATGTWDLPGAEPVEEFRARVLGAFEDVLGRHGHRQSVAVVSHGAAINTVLRLMSEGIIRLADGAAPPDLSPLANCAVVELRLDRGVAGAACWLAPTRLSPVFQPQGGA
jgi:broad specificity phosphatase PhoE